MQSAKGAVFYPGQVNLEHTRDAQWGGKPQLLGVQLPFYGSEFTNAQKLPTNQSDLRETNHENMAKY